MNLQDVFTAYFPSAYPWYSGSSNLWLNPPCWWVGVCFLTAEFWKFFVYSVCCCCCWIAKSYPTLWDPMDCSPPGSSVHGILQAITLEWVAMSSSEDLPNPGAKPAGDPAAVALEAESLPLSRQGSSLYSVYKPFIRYMLCRNFLPVCDSSLHFCNNSFSEQKFLILKMFNWSIFFLHVSYWKIHPQTQVM